MGGRFNVGYVQLTLVLKEGVDEEMAESWCKAIGEKCQTDDVVLDVLLDDYGNKDVEV